MLGKKLGEKLIARWWRVSHSQGRNQIYLFNKKPALHLGFTQKTVYDAIVELQQRLQAKNYPVRVNGKFDAETEQAVKAFQRDHDLLEDGVVGPLTWACLYYPNLFRGIEEAAPEIKSAIEKLQTVLAEDGFPVCDAMGHFGRSTERAVKKFQKKHGLKVDGYVGSIIWAVLLGMRQKSPQTFFLLLSESLSLCDQCLKISFIVLGMRLTAASQSLSPLYILAIAYVLAEMVPVLMKYLPLNGFEQSQFNLFRYAPYLGTGIFSDVIISKILDALKEI